VFGVSGVGCRVSGFGVWGLGLRFEVSSFGCRVLGFVCRL